MSETLDQNYARAGYHTAQRWGSRPAVILIDFANAYFDEKSPLYGGEGCASALKHAIRLSEGARAAKIPVIFTEVVYQPGGADGGAFFAKVPALSCFEVGRETQKLEPGLTVGPDDLVISKQYPSAFFATSLASTLHFAKIDTVLLAGVTTSGCVRATCVDAISHGFVTIVVSDAVGDRAEAPHQANLFDMSAKYADLATTDEVLQKFRSAPVKETHP
ncbi:MAG: isochorismatase family protein [Pseudomonadota bacterium]